jgi:copper(I)-binding protein
MLRTTRRRSPVPRSAAWCVVLALALSGSDADALFIVNQPWVVPAAKGRSTAAYMDLTSTEGATLVAAKSDAAESVTIRGPKGTPRGAPLALPARMMIHLAPNGYRLVLDKLTRPIKRGERVLLMLTIEAADGLRQEIGVDAEARLNSPLDEERHSHTH